MQTRNPYFALFDDFAIIFFESINPLIDLRLYDR